MIDEYDKERLKEWIQENEITNEQQVYDYFEYEYYNLWGWLKGQLDNLGYEFVEGDLQYGYVEVKDNSSIAGNVEDIISEYGFYAEVDESFWYDGLRIVVKRNGIYKDDLDDVHISIDIYDYDLDMRIAEVYMNSGEGKGWTLTKLYGQEELEELDGEDRLRVEMGYKMLEERFKEITEKLEQVIWGNRDKLEKLISDFFEQADYIDEEIWYAIELVEEMEEKEVVE